MDVLMSAIDRGDLRILSLIVKHMASCTRRSNNEELDYTRDDTATTNPILYAVKEMKRTEIVSILIKAGYDM